MSENPHPSEGRSPLDPWSLERLLSGDEDAPPALQEHPLARLVEAGRAPGTAQELAGEAAAVASFAAAVGSGVLTSPTPRHARRISMLSSLLAGKIAVAAAASAVALGGTAAAAYTGSLPSSLQELAHTTIGAPAPHGHGTSGTETVGSDEHGASGDHKPSDQATPKGPDATGPAAFGLCTAYTKGGLATPSTAYKALEQAATSAGESIADYCATVAHPGQQQTPAAGKSGDHKPTTTPGHRPETVPPTGKPAGVPTPNGNATHAGAH